MRVRGVAIVCVVLAVAGGAAQIGGVAAVPDASRADAPKPWWQTALQHGTLTVWMVSKATTDDKLRIGRERLTAAIQPSKVYVEKTTSELGQPSNTYGQTASTYGQTSGSFGTAASNVGQTAGSAGTSPSNVGTSSSNYGQTAGSYGQTAGSFGQTAGSYGTVASDSNKLQPVVRHRQDAQQREIASELHEVFPSLTVQVEDVTDLELKERLTAAKGTAAYPDVVVGVEYLNGWWQSGLGVTMLGELPVDGGPSSYVYIPGTVDLLIDAPHGDAARAFWVWVSGAWRCPDCGGDGTKIAAEVPVILAQSALRRVLAGAALGADADKDAAEFGLQEAAGMALASYSRGGQASAAEMKVQIDTLSGFVAGSVAAVSLRAEVSSTDSFGVLNVLVVLRKAGDGRWKVLQISPNQRVEARTLLYQDLRSAAEGKVSGPVLQPVSLASPQDGETRPEHPELWWDNNGQAQLEVVEWQMALAGTWTASQLLAVVDTSVRVQTRATATFAQQGSRYRWRVWSVSRGGVLVLTGWRTFNVQGR